MRYLITLSYDGSQYYGFQRLNKEKTIQKELEDALTIINKEEVLVKGSGRTDKGVHAIKQKCHFDLSINIPPKRLKNAINSLIPNSIYVTNCKYVDDNFHARFNVKKKVYTYLINTKEFNPIKDKYLYNYCKDLNINLIRKASKILIGKHNYEVFVSGKRDNYNSEIYKISVSKKDNIVKITFIGKSFYRYMVRNLVGVLISISNNKISLNDLYDMVNNNKKINYTTVPANGLYLMNVIY